MLPPLLVYPVNYMGQSYLIGGHTVRGIGLITTIKRSNPREETPDPTLIKVRAIDLP